MIIRYLRFIGNISIYLEGSRETMIQKPTVAPKLELQRRREMTKPSQRYVKHKIFFAPILSTGWKAEDLPLQIRVREALFVFYKSLFLS